MIQKGTDDYRAAQKIANDLQVMASYDNESVASCDFSMAKTEVEMFCKSIKSLDCFAAQIAETVLRTMARTYRIVAPVSSKQAWILACAAVENGISIDRI